MENKDNLYIIIPAYNEEANIEKVVDEWHLVVEGINRNSKLVVLNDESTDSTLNILHKLEKKYNQLIVIDKRNSGHGGTILQGYKYAIGKGAKFIFQTDSDGQTLTSEFMEFWRKREKYDMIIGHRNSREDGISRIVVTKILKMVISLIFRVNIPDANTPFRLMESKALEQCLKFVPADFNLSNIVISVSMIKLNKKCRWYPITFRPRQGGVNSINLRRIVGIGRKALSDFSDINKRINDEINK